MSILAEPTKGNLTISIMYVDENELAEIKSNLIELYGEIDMESEHYSFSEISPYYDPEMGEGIKKVIFSFKKLIPREFVREVKLKAVEIEEMYSTEGNRRINLDPGLVTLENFLLTTGKNYSHRIYLGRGVFAEITLIFSKDTGIRELPWTYRDYLYEPARSFLLEMRENFRRKLKEERRK